jgi:hypothetical protein
MIKFVIFSTKGIAMVLTALLLSSCNANINLGESIDGNGNVTKQTRNVGTTFTKIDANRGLNVIIEQSDSYFVEVEADENLQSHITTKVENETLIITTDENIDESTAKNVRVKMPNLNDLESSSGTSVKTIGVVTGTEINIKTSSGSETNLNIEFDKITCQSTSGSSLNVRGKALRVTTRSSSGSTIDARDLIANEIDSESSSGSSTQVHPVVRLIGKASSGSSINFIGSPKTVTKEESSGGSVSKD